MIGLGFTVILLVTLWATRSLHKKDSSVKRNVRGLEKVVGFLESLNALPPEITEKDLHDRILQGLRQVLLPLGVHSRLWVANPNWQTLRALGEHPAQRPGAPQHLPMSACPAYAFRSPFRYTQKKGDPCSSEQFNYQSHLCLPLVNENRSFGVLFLGTYEGTTWKEGDTQLFEMLAQAIALTLQRHTLFKRLEEKIADLRFSFEVGAAALATFSGSTQSMEETTLHILDSVLSILKVDRASLMLWDPQSKTLQTQWTRGGDFKIQSPLRLKMGEGMAGWALETGTPYWAEYAMSDPHYAPSVQTVRSLLCVPLTNANHEPLGVINAMTTSTPRAFRPQEVEFLVSFGRQAALAIENARLHKKNRDNIEQLHEVSTLKTQFLSWVSHDLRGPLTGIRGYCEVLRQEQRGPLTPLQIELMDQLERQVELQERMVDDLLDLARMEKGRLSIQPSPTDMASLLQEETEKAQREARERGVTLSLALENPADMGSVQVDGGRMRQVIWNLIFNALKFTPEEGRVTVNARVNAEALYIEVEDSGVGLALETQDRVFDKFFQVSPGGSISSQGLGLGLAICKEIVHAHHGTIHAKSPGLGKGTTISFSIPFRQLSANETPKKLAA